MNPGEAILATAEESNTSSHRQINACSGPAARKDNQSFCAVFVCLFVAWFLVWQGRSWQREPCATSQH
jgi:hypothetical protein